MKLQSPSRLAAQASRGARLDGCEGGVSGERLVLDGRFHTNVIEYDDNFDFSFIFHDGYDDDDILYSILFLIELSDSFIRLLFLLKTRIADGQLRYQTSPRRRFIHVTIDGFRAAGGRRPLSTRAYRVRARFKQSLRDGR